VFFWLLLRSTDLAFSPKFLVKAAMLHNEQLLNLNVVILCTVFLRMKSSEHFSSFLFVMKSLREDGNANFKLHSQTEICALEHETLRSLRLWTKNVLSPPKCKPMCWILQFHGV
jgi:hypothetical protein